MTAATRWLDTLRSIDEHAEELREDSRCAWVRSTFGIIGRVSVSHILNAAALDAQVSEEVAHALAEMDKIPDKDVGQEELWNLLLFIGVPWTRGEGRDQSDVAMVLARWARNTIGCRKVILWSDVDIRNHLGPLGVGGESWAPPSGDPLREALSASALDDEERGALEVLFKRRIETSDIEQVI